MIGVKVSEYLGKYGNILAYQTEKKDFEWLFALITVYSLKCRGHDNA